MTTPLHDDHEHPDIPIFTTESALSEKLGPIVKLIGGMRDLLAGVRPWAEDWNRKYPMMRQLSPDDFAAVLALIPHIDRCLAAMSGYGPPKPPAHEDTDNEGERDTELE